MTRILVTGSAGLVGSQVIKDLAEENKNIFSCYYNSKPSFGNAIFLDLADKQNIVDVMEKTKPDAVIHLAAMTNVDLCETQQATAMSINADATEVLARESAKQHAFFVYISTDYVFDGYVGMRKESDMPNPICIYGKSKLEGEKRIEKLTSPWAIARISTPFGMDPTKKSFPVWVKENLEKNQEISVFVDQYTSPTYVPNLSKMLIEIVTKKITGIIHVSGASRISRYNMAELVAKKLNLDRRFLKPISINEIQWVAKRPKDSSLDVSHATSILENKPLTIEQGLDLFSNSQRT